MPLVATPENPAPPGAVVETLIAVDGVRLRSARWSPPGQPRGTVAIFGGRAEFIEKYHETIGDLLARGLAVAMLDWRGQGGSERQLRNRRKGHIDDFSLYLRDLDAILDQVLEPFCPKPWFALGHSMGGAVSLLATAGSIELARQFIEELLPDLLLLDLSLSDGNAADCIAAFGALAPAMDIAIHSNDASAFTRQKCLDAGAKWFFDKSGELEDLIGFVQERALLAA